MMKKTAIIIVFLIFCSISVIGQTHKYEAINEPLKVFYDGSGSFFNYLRTDIDFVRFVRNPDDAQVQLQMNSQSSADMGKRYTFIFEGGEEFTGINDTIVTSVAGNVSDNTRNEQLLRVIKLGLAYYLSKTPFNKNVDIISIADIEIEEEEDNWDGWIFSVGLNSSFEGEESRKEFMWEIDLDVDRVKETSKIKINGDFSNELKEYESDDGLSTSNKRNRQLDFLYVHSISQQFSAGFFTGVGSKTFENIDFGYNFYPAVEYNIYPYHESVRKNFTFRYMIGYLHYNYLQKTIYNKDEEDLLRHALSVDYELNELWGQADINLEASNYLHDFSKNRIELRTRLSFRLTGSFYFNIETQVSYVNDQIYLPIEEATLEEILLNQTKLSTQYEYELKFGVRYTFGSIYNSVVNTRF